MGVSLLLKSWTDILDSLHLFIISVNTFLESSVSVINELWRIPSMCWLGW